jgi:hypothetical protein
VVLTVALAVLSYVRVSPSGVSYRSPEVWSNQSTLVLTQEGAPELRSVLPAGSSGGPSSLADTSRFAGLIDVYAALATSDPVIQMLRRRGLIDEQTMANGVSPITAAAVVSTVGGGTTPMLTLTAQAPTPAAATKLTRAATKAFVTYVASRQAAANIPLEDRIQLRVVKSADEPTLMKPRSKALPILVLLGGLIATAAVVFTRDNLARRQGAPALAATPARREPIEPDSSVGAADSRPTLGPVPRRDAVTARKESDGRSSLGPVPRPEPVAARKDNESSIGLARPRSTLGSVPAPDPTPASEPDGADAAAQQVPRRRRARTSGRRQT